MCLCACNHLLDINSRTAHCTLHCCLQIAKTPYGHFAVLKAASYCTSASDQTLVHNALRGHFVSLGTNVIGARCCESVMQLFPKKLTRGLKAEFYGKVSEKCFAHDCV